MVPDLEGTVEDAVRLPFDGVYHLERAYETLAKLVEATPQGRNTKKSKAPTTEGGSELAINSIDNGPKRDGSANWPKTVAPIGRPVDERQFHTTSVSSSLKSKIPMTEMVQEIAVRRSEESRDLPAQSPKDRQVSQDLNLSTAAGSDQTALVKPIGFAQSPDLQDAPQDPHAQVSNSYPPRQTALAETAVGVTGGEAGKIPQLPPSPRKQVGPVASFSEIDRAPMLAKHDHKRQAPPAQSNGGSQIREGQRCVETHHPVAEMTEASTAKSLQNNPVPDIKERHLPVFVRLASDQSSVSLPSTLSNLPRTIHPDSDKPKEPSPDSGAKMSSDNSVKTAPPRSEGLERNDVRPFDGPAPASKERLDVAGQTGLPPD